MSLQLSSKFSLPREAVLWTFAFLAIKGAGKTYDAAKLAEQMLKHGFPIVVLDPIGIWWGLRVGIEGREGFPIVIIGGDHGDLGIPLHEAKKNYTIVDEAKLRQMVIGILLARLSVIVDTSRLKSRTQQTRTVAIFADELMNQNAKYGIRHVFIEEADQYCPQKPMGETQASHAAVDRLIRIGGNFNLGGTMITQRAAVLDKDVLSQTTCLVALRTVFVRDKNAIREWVKNAVKNEAEMKRLAKWYDSLKKLKNGEGWIYSPEHDIFERVQFGQRETLHASREYFLQETWEQKNITLRDVTEFVKAYKAKIEPKPSVQTGKPSVASVITAKDSAVSAIKREISQAAPVGEAVDKTIGQPTVRWPETVGESPSQIHNSQPTLDKMEVRISPEQETPVQVHLSSPGPVESLGRTQYDPALGESSEQIVNFDLIEVRYVIHHKPDQETTLSTATQEGKTMYVMVNDRRGQPSGFSQIKEALQERAWAISDNALAPTLGGLVKKGLLIAEGATKAKTYRLPKLARITVVNHRD